MGRFSFYGNKKLSTNSVNYKLIIVVKVSLAILVIVAEHVSCIWLIIYFIQLTLAINVSVQ